MACIVAAVSCALLACGPSATVTAVAASTTGVPVVSARTPPALAPEARVADHAAAHQRPRPLASWLANGTVGTGATNVDPCDPPCPLHSRCELPQYVCRCDTGWTGPSCQVDAHALGGRQVAAAVICMGALVVALFVAPTYLDLAQSASIWAGCGHKTARRVRKEWLEAPAAEPLSELHPDVQLAGRADDDHDADGDDGDGDADSSDLGSGGHSGAGVSAAETSGMSLLSVGSGDSNAYYSHGSGGGGLTQPLLARV